ncbi:MscL family protein [Dermatophilaceae bacterium Sec6.4]|nr:MscL family protein [Actinomycetota bacterium]
MKGFKDFILRGNLIELAVAFVVAAAFAALVKATVEILLAIVGKVGGAQDFSSYKPSGIPVGGFLTALISFLTISAVVYFVVVLPYNKYREMREKNVDTESDPTELDILAQIRDELKARPHN